MQFASHPNSCPIRLEHQGKTYSIHGTTPGYTKLDDVVGDELFHPNCKCEWVLFFDDNDSTKVEGDYELGQQQIALERTIQDYESDSGLYQCTGNNEKCRRK